MATKSLGRVSIVPQGDYDENQVYKRLDLVKDDGKTYLSLKEDNVNALSDADSWMLITESGRFEDLTPQELETLLQPLNKSIEDANQAAENANTAAENALSGIKDEATTATVPGTTGFERYIVHEAGIYTNFLSGGSPIEVTSADLDVVSGVANNRVILEVQDGVATKRVERVKGDAGPAADPAKLPIYNASNSYAAESQFIYENIIYRVKPGQTLNVGELPTNFIVKLETVGGDGSSANRQVEFDATHIFTDEEGAIIAYISTDGYFRFYIDDFQRGYIIDGITEAQRQNINNLKITANEDYVFIIEDAEGKVIFSIGVDGITNGAFNDLRANLATKSNVSEVYTNSFPLNYELEYTISSQKTIVNALNLPTTAVGKESSEGADDAPTVTLTNKGYAHPSIVYHPSGWNGYKYWLAFTPYFSPLVGSVYENPTIMVSNDGIEWKEPEGINNPVDVPQALPNNGYWSDTHLKLGDDGHLHLWYRGNYMDFNGVAYTRFVVHRKSRDGVNWSDATLVYSTSDAPLAADNQIVSPAFFKEGSYWNCYDVIIKSETGGLAPTSLDGKNQTNKFIIRRTSLFPEKDYEIYSKDKCINFTNRPWGETNDTWHLDAHKFGNSYWLLLSVGSTSGSASESLWLAYSGDGWNFTVIEEPLMDSYNYRSCIVFKDSVGEEITMDLYIGNTYGYFELRQIKVKQINN